MSMLAIKASPILLIRHAEKPLGKQPPYGVSPKGERDDEALTVQGWLRAGALACLLTSTSGPLAASSLGQPQAIYAARFQKGRGSKRSEQTVTPLSKKLGLPINTQFAKGDEAALVKDISTRQGAVLICWQHEKLLDIVGYILGSKALGPQAWPDDRYDLIWICEWDVATGQYTFKQMAQALLNGDVGNPLK